MKNKILYKIFRKYSYDEDTNKNIRQYEIFNPDNKLVLSVEYDEKGNIYANAIEDYSQKNKEVYYYRDVENYFSHNFTQLFDDNQNLIQEEYIGIGNSYVKKLEYNAQNQLIEEYFLSYSEKEKSDEHSTHYQYNEKGNCILSECLYIFHTLLKSIKVEFFYNEDNLKIQEIQTIERVLEGENISNVKTRDFVYDVKGNLAKIIEKQMDMYKEVCYNDRGDIISSIYSQKGEPYPNISIYNYSYDNRGNITEKKHYNEAGLYETEKHIFDEYNNLKESFYYDKKQNLITSTHWEYCFEQEENEPNSYNFLNKKADCCIKNRIELLENTYLEEQVYLEALLKIQNSAHKIQDWLEEHKQLFIDTVDKTTFKKWKNWKESDEAYNVCDCKPSKITHSTLFMEKYYFVEKLLSYQDFPKEYFEIFVNNLQRWDFTEYYL